MRRLTAFDLHILGAVSKHERICIGLPVFSEWAPVAADLRRLVKWKYLVEDGVAMMAQSTRSPRRGAQRLFDRSCLSVYGQMLPDLPARDSGSNPNLLGNAILRRCSGPWSGRPFWRVPKTA